MNQGQTVFSQVFSFIDRYQFDKCVLRYKGNFKVQSFTCWEQFLTMGFAQLTYRESLRDIEACLGAIGKKTYHIGIKGRVSKSTLADANENRDWRIYADFAQVLISEARQLYKDDNDFAIDLEGTVYALDSTTIDLCLKLFPWARFRKAKGAVKMHTLLDLKGNIPSFIYISDGLLSDVNILDDLCIEPGATYIMDRGYIDWERLFWIEANCAFFITRAKSNLAFNRVLSRPVDKSEGLVCDQTITLKIDKAKQAYPEKLRRIVYYDKITDNKLVFLTNNFTLSALVIAALYKQRWQVELFFKWIKQHLRLKVFYGTSRNAVYTQIWIAVSMYVLIAIIKKKIQTKMSLYTMLQILSLSLFEKTPINQLFKKHIQPDENTDIYNQLTLFDL
jgi:hypothetical protein